MATLTVANSVFTLSCPAVLPIPVQIQGFSVDDAFDTGEVKPNEAIMGVDGVLSGGYVAYPTPLSFMLQADSPSILVMDTIIEAMDSVQEAYPLSATIVAPGVGKIWTFTQGWLTSAKKTPDGKKLLQPQKYSIDFQSCISAPI